MKLDFMENK